MNLKKEITLYLLISYNVEQAERTEYILSLIRERVSRVENPHYRRLESSLCWEEARQAILKELE